METQFSRSELVLGSASTGVLKKARIAVFGAGGVGGYAIEALARAGVGSIAIFDPDAVSLTNLNRQIIALHSTLGLPKAEVAAARVRDVNPDCEAVAYRVFYSAENADLYDLSRYSYVVDAIDSVSSKICLIERANAAGVPIISAMGAGNKLDPTRFEVADIYKTSVCPLARVMRRELKARGVKSLKTVYSREQPTKCAENSGEKTPPGSLPFVPAAAGLLIASEVVKDLLKSAGL